MTRANDRIWAEIIAHYHLDFKLPLNTVTKEQIDSVRGRRDLRNIVSMTSVAQWATPLQEAGVFVLPKSREEWMLVHGRGYYQNLGDPGEPKPFPSRLPIKLTTLSYGRSESGYLKHAFHAGLIAEFSHADSQLFDTVSGKYGVPDFQFRVDGSPELRPQQGTQMEIDQGYENTTDVLLFEAKVGAQTDFLIRQLYYPFRSHLDFQAKTGHKKVRPFFLVADDVEDTYTLWEFKWSDSGDYETIGIEDGRPPSRYRIIEAEVAPDEYTNIPRDRSIPEIQANDLDKVTAFPFLIPQGIDTAKKWVDYQGWSKWPRQGNYYGSAAAALGLVNSEDGRFVLTDEGRRFVTLSPQERDKLTAERLLKVPTINRVFLLAHEKGPEGVTDADISRVIAETQGLSGTTPRRRASTVRAWFKWFAVATGTVVVEKQRIFSREGWEKRSKR